ncbi:unnamed protein product [Lactuca saligna]|nr:unnamed protein product [Lactuca saligna]
MFKSSVDRDISAGFPIAIQTLNFPASEVGIESLNASTNQEMSSAVIRGAMMLQTSMEHLIRSLSADCIFSDMFFPFTVDLEIPRLLFYPSSIFYHSIFDSLKVHKPHEKVKSESETFVNCGSQFAR